MKTLLRFLAALLLLTGVGVAAPFPALAPAAPIEARIPPEARKVLAYVREHRQAPMGHVGGRRFGNFERRLPLADAWGRRIAYQEWDVFPRRDGRSRGVHRLVTGSDGRAWYTGDHYASFQEIKEWR